MSVIQKALEKAESELRPYVDVPEIMRKDKITDPKPVPQLDAKKPKNAPPIRGKIIMAAVLLVCAAIAFFFIGRSLAKISGGLYVTPDMRAQEVHYKPITRSVEKSPAALIKPAERVEKMPDSPRLILNGIMYMEEGPRAIVNNYVVEPGDSISGAKVTKINPQSVVLEYGNVEITLNLK